MPLGQPFLGEFKEDTKVVFIIIYYFIYSVHIKPPRHRFGLSLCLGLAIQMLIRSHSNRLLLLINICIFCYSRNENKEIGFMGPTQSQS